jgi:hypothetical protein
MRSPSFHWPRFLRSSVRSKRLRTLRLPPRVDAARRLRCCDINCFWLYFSRLNKKRTVYISDLWVNCQWLIWHVGLLAPQPQYQGGAAATALPTLHRVIAATTSIPAIAAQSNPECRLQPGSTLLRHAHHFAPQGIQGHRLVQHRQLNGINEFLELGAGIQPDDKNKPPGQ